MTMFRLICILLILSFPTIRAEEKPKLRVCIIGGGISGSTSSFFLNKHLSNYDLFIDLYEASSRLGGRLQHMSPRGETIEQGASIVHDTNEYIKNITKMLGLSYGPPKLYGKQEMGIWDGTQFVITTSTNNLVTALRMLWRYGISVFHLFKAISNVHARFQQLYDIQRSDHAHETVQGLLEQVQLWHLTQITLTQFLESYHYVNDSRLLKEFGSVMTRINYGQDVVSVNALAGAVGLIPFTNPHLFQIYTGNVEIVEKLFNYTHTHVHMQHRVIHITEINHDNDKKYRLTVRDEKHQNKIHKEYDLVIIATPLESSSITFDHMTSTSTTPTPIDFHLPKRSFQQTHATFVTGRVNPAFFNVSSVPGSILTPEYVSTSPSHPIIPFTTIAIQQHINNTHAIYKIFSRTEMTEKMLDILFEYRINEETQRIPWSAYPHYTPPEQYASFHLLTGVYYVNTFENTASCLEVMAVAANNVALLIKQQFNGVSAPLWPDEFPSRSASPSASVDDYS